MQQTRITYCQFESLVNYIYSLSLYSCSSSLLNNCSVLSIFDSTVNDIKDVSKIRCCRRVKLNFIMRALIWVQKVEPQQLHEQLIKALDDCLPLDLL